jgi:hypothetical protein
VSTAIIAIGIKRQSRDLLDEDWQSLLKDLPVPTWRVSLHGLQKLWEYLFMIICLGTITTSEGDQDNDKTKQFILLWITSRPSTRPPDAGAQDHYRHRDKDADTDADIDADTNANTMTTPIQVVPLSSCGIHLS